MESTTLLHFSKDFFKSFAEKPEVYGGTKFHLYRRNEIPPCIFAGIQSIIDNLKVVVLN